MRKLHSYPCRHPNDQWDSHLDAGCPGSLLASALHAIELRALAAQVGELTKLHSRVSSLQKLSDSMTKLQTLERKAFGISDTDGGSDPLATMTDAELRAEIARLEGLTGTSAVGLG